MDGVFNSCPPMDFAALEEEILSTALEEDNYLFYRSGRSFSGWPEADMDGWELHCTACHQRMIEPKRHGFQPGKLEKCLVCGAMVTAKRWLAKRVKLRTRILYFKLRRGDGRRVWLHAYHVTHDFCPTPGDERLEFFEAARYLFDDGRARKWRRFSDYYGWEEVKRVKDTSWYPNVMYACPPYPACIGRITKDEIRGSCLEYSQLDRAIDAGFDIPVYLDFYVRNPMIEYLWKSGLSGLLWEGLMTGHRVELRKAVDLKAKRPRDLLRGLTVHEVRQIAENRTGLAVIVMYQRLRKTGVVTDCPAGWEWARAACGREQTVKRAAGLGIDGKRLRAYIERQSRRSGHSLQSVLGDWDDYLDQLRQLGAEDGELLPDDLRAAHERLSARLRKLGCAGLNRWFRIRRRLYAWMCWRNGGYFIRPVDSAEEITREGEQQRNCVAGYANRHADGTTVICVLRKASAPRESWHTVELDPETFTVRQCRGFRNADAAPEAQAFVEVWSKRLRKIRAGRTAGRKTA